MSELKTQNITETDIAFGKIANGLQSAASDHILGIAKDIYDTKQQAYQEDINEYLLNKIDGFIGDDNTEDEDETFLDAVLERDVLAEVTIGGIELGTTLEEGMTFTEFVERLFTLINYGSIGSISSYGNVSIGAPIIKVEKYENGSWISIDTGTTVKENTTVRVLVTDIPKSIFEDVWAGIKKGGTNPGNVLAYGWLKSVNDGEVITGNGDCEISTKTKITGEDYLTIPTSSNTGIFASLKKNDDGKIEMQFTVPASTSNSTTQAGKITVNSNSATYQLQSANKNEIAAVSSKHASKPEELDKIPDKRKLIIEKDTNIGASKNSNNTQSFILNVEGWGVVPSLTTSGNVSIKAPKITVYNVTEQKDVLSGDSLNPKHTIRVDVNLNGTSTISGNSASLIKSTDSEFKHGWEKTKGSGTAVPGSGNCEIGTKISHVGDILEFTGTKNGLFNDSDFKIEDNKISFTKTVGNDASEFSVVAKSGRHKLLADDNYNVYALSSIGSSVKSTNFNNHYSCNKDDVLKTYNTKTSSISRFYFNLLGNPWGYVPDITLNGAVKINAPTIEVKDSNGNKINSGTKLDPRTQLNVTVTIPQHTMSTPISAYYKQSGNYLLYGWQLWSNGTIEIEKGTGNCTIVTKTTNTSDKLEITGASGVFAGTNGMSVTNNSSISFNTTASEASSFTVSAIPSEYTVYPAKDYIIYSLSELGDIDSNNTNTVDKLFTTSSIGKISGNKSSASFSFSLQEELWITMPNIVRTGGALSFGNPTIYVEKTNGTEVNSGDTLDPSDKLNITITLPKSSVSSASYSADVSKLTYGWKLLQNGVETTGGPTDKCNIHLEVDKTSDDTHKITGSGAFSGLSTTTLTKTGVSVGTGGKLTISSTSGIYTINPKYSDCKIYSISSYGNTTDTNNKYYKTPPRDTINRTTKTATFEYFVKAATYSPFFYWAVPGEINWDLWDDNNPTGVYSGNVRTLLDKITNNISDEELSNIGMTKYNASEHSYPGGRQLTKGTFLVILTDGMPSLSATPNGPNGLIYERDEKYFLMKEITRNGKIYGVYVFPDAQSAGSTFYDLKMTS